MILTNTRFRRRPSNSPQKIRSQVPKVLVSTAKPSRRPSATGYGDHRFTPNHLPIEVRIGIIFPGAVVQPASGPTASLMEMRGVMFRAWSWVNTRFIISRL
jgi:hypothetical protein